MSSEDGHSVSILDAHGKRVEWNGEDYVEEGSTCSRSETDRESEKIIVDLCLFVSFP